MTNVAPVVAIDGPSGSGKGTLSQRLAALLGWHYLDSGALYRLTALAARDRGVALDDAGALRDVAATLDARFEVLGDAGERILLDGREVGPELRSEQTGDGASRVAAIPAVRAALLARQRDYRLRPGLVADGRDMGSVVFPDAEVKIFLTASPEARAERRYKQLKGKGLDANLVDLVGELSERDRRDTQRAVAPLRAASDAIGVDSSKMGIEDVLMHVLGIVRERLADPGRGSH